MNLFDLVWHVLNFAAPALFMGAISSAAAKLLWRKPLRGWTWIQLCVRVAVTSLIVSVAGLAITGRDGKMITYAGMVLTCAACLWWSTRRR